MALELTDREIIAEYKRRFGDVSLLAFSRGKDSIASYLAMRDHLDVVPVHYTLVPGLSFVDESLDYFERKLFKRRIIRMLHPSFYRWTSEMLYQPLHNAEVISAAGLETPDYTEIGKWVRQQEKVDARALAAVGVRAADNPHRRRSATRHGVFRVGNQTWWPVCWWNKADVISSIQKAGIQLPVDYEMFGRSFDGLDARFMIPLRRHRPKDYEQVCKWFPLVGAEIKRYEMHHGIKAQ